LNTVLSYIKFWWHSKNEHGVHSPFVYALVTKCFYDRTKHNAYSQLYKTDSKSKLLIRLVAYFKFETCFIPEKISKNFEHVLKLNTKTIKFKTIEDLMNLEATVSKTPSLIYLDSKTIKQHSTADFLKFCHRDSVIIVESIRETQSQFKYWKRLKSALEISVSIDTFYWGLLFFRTEQPKEHFTIRL